MGIVYRKQNRHTVNNAKNAAAEMNDTHDCPNCGNESKIIEKYKDRAVYKCTKCNAKNTYTISPNQVKKVRRKNNKSDIIVVRDRSKEIKNTKQECDAEEDDNTVEQLTPMLTTIRQGMKESKRLSFEYTSKSGTSVRDVEPYKLTRNKKGELIVYAYCKAGQGIRVFKLDKIKDLKILDKQYEPRWVQEDQVRR